MRKASGVVLILGAALVLASFGQYGFMVSRQHALRQQWNAIGTPAQAAYTARESLRMRIPRIHLDDAVVHGTDYEDLLVAPGLLQGSPLPQQGGNTVIAGHRDTFFRHIAEIRPGDWVELSSRGQSFFYRVTLREVVKPDDVSVIAPSTQATLTLITCYPTYWIGPAPDRLVVRAKRVNLPAAGAAEIH